MMSRRCFYVFCFLSVLVSTGFNIAQAREAFTFALADDMVRITTGFTGTKLVIFGTIDRDGVVLMKLEGPHKTAMVRRKEPIVGAWVNREWLRFDDMPTYYDFAVSEQGEEVLPPLDIRKEKHLGMDTLYHPPRKKRYDDKTVETFQKALIRNKQDEGLYPRELKKVEFLSEGFFKVQFDVPANVPSGDYTLTGYLVRDGKIVAEHDEVVHIGLEGFSSSLYVFSKDYAFFYGLLCVVLAVMAGWVSNVLVQRS